MIRRALTAIKAHLIYVVPGSLAAGLAFGQVAGPETKEPLTAVIGPALFPVRTGVRSRLDEQLDVGLGHLLERGGGPDADGNAVEKVRLVVAEEVDGHLTRL